MSSDQIVAHPTAQSGRLAGKVAIITGGARGQGESEAGLFVQHGATVVITDVLEAEGMATADRLGCTFLRHDVTQEDDWAAVVAATLEMHGKLDVLVNNAGIFPVGGVLDTTLAAWERVIAINQTGVFLGMQAAGRHMVTQRSGSIINISSIAGLQGTPGFHGYGASKWAVRGMTKSAAKEFAAFGVRVNSVHPGIIDTPMLQTFEEISPDIRGAVVGRIPNGRIAEALDVANLVLYLASDESSYSTGSEFGVDGGWTA